MAGREARLNNARRRAHTAIKAVNYTTAHLDETDTKKIEKEAINVNRIMWEFIELNATNGKIFQELEDSFQALKECFQALAKEEG